MATPFLSSLKPNMTILVCSDVHANLTALEAVLQDAGTVDEVWCLGDVVGYGPDPNECIELLMQQPGLVCLLGNHDAATLDQIPLSSFNREARINIEWVQSVLKAHNLAFLQALPERRVIGQVTLTHGSPRNPVWEYLLDTVNAAENMRFFETQICMVGHTHLPVIFQMAEQNGLVERAGLKTGQTIEIDRRSILNPGSVGQPRDRDPRAAYALFDPQTMSWQPRRVEYSVGTVQQRIFNAGLPTRHALRLIDGW